MADAQITAIDNLLVGAGTLASGGVATMMNNLATTAPGFVDQATYDYHLVPGSPAIDSGLAPAMALAPVLDHVQPASTEPRAIVGAAIDLGADEYGNAPAAGDGPPPGDDTPTSGGPAGGCDCRTHDAPGALLGGLVVALALRRRRRSGLDVSHG